MIPKTIRKMLRQFEEDNIDWSDWLRLKIADKKANKANPDYTDDEIKSFVKKIKDALSYENKAFSVTDLKINGNQIMEITGLKPGKHIGNILDYLLNSVIENPELNTYDELSKLVKVFDFNSNVE